MAHHRVAECVEGIFYPPQRTLGFNAQLQLNDSLLAQSYVEAYDISYPEAVRRLESQVEEIKQAISIDGAYEFHGIGVIRLDADGRYLFEPCLAGLLTPSLYGFDSFCMDMLEMRSGNERELDKTFIQNASSAVSQEDTLELEDTSTDQEEHHVMYLSIIKYAAAVLLILFAFTFSIITGDRSVSNISECSVVNTQMLSNIITSESSCKSASPKVKKEEKKEVSSQKAESENKEEQALAQQSTVAGKEYASDGKVEQKKADEAKKTVETKNNEIEKSYYAIVLASKITKAGAEEFVANLSKDGLKDASIYERGTMRRVVYGHYPTEEKAHEALRTLRDQNEVFADAWAGEVKK